MGACKSKSDLGLHGTAAQFEPIPVQDVKAGETKHWCRCGLSKNQPWCDGSHEGTGITPLPWTVEKTPDVPYYMCACKQTKNPPFCDGSHTTARNDIKERSDTCKLKDMHVSDCRLCNNCGWNPSLEF